MLLKHHDLKPWREKMWCVGRIDAAYRTRMETVLATDEQPLTPAAPVRVVGVPGKFSSPSVLT
jgi:hypothetical protein